MAHLLEHLLFKGTPKHPHGLGRVHQARPARQRHDELRPHQLLRQLRRQRRQPEVVPRRGRPTRWSTASSRRKDLDSEMTVVRNEMESGENDPQRILLQRDAGDACTQWHNYGKPTIGARTDVENVDIGRLQAFYRAVLPARQRDADRLGQVRSGARCWRWVQAIVRHDPEAQAHAAARCTRSTRRRTASAASRCAASAACRCCWPATTCRPAAHPDYRGGRGAGADPRRRAVRPRCTGAWSQKQLRRRRVGWALGSRRPGVIDVRRAARAGAGRRRGARRAARDGRIVGREADHRRRARRARRPSGSTSWERASRIRSRSASRLSDAVAQGDWRLFFLLRDRVRDAEARRRAARRDAVRCCRRNRTLGTYVPTDKPQRAPPPERSTWPRRCRTSSRRRRSRRPKRSTPRRPTSTRARSASRWPAGMKVALLPKGTRGQAVAGAAGAALRRREEPVRADGEVPEFVARDARQGHAPS